MPDLLEAYSGVDIVRWANQIKHRLGRMAQEQDGNRNHEYAGLIRNFLNTWQANQITGSINRETLEVLRAAASPLAVMNWPPSSYFAGVETSLLELIADQEALPTGVPTDQNSPMTGGAGFSSPPMDNEFGPQKDAPRDLGEPALDGASPSDVVGEPKPVDDIPVR